MLLQKKFPKLIDPEFYLDFIGRYTRRGLSFFDTLECVCSFFGIIISCAFIAFLIPEILGRSSRKPDIISWILIIAWTGMAICMILHANKERPRWAIARYYQHIARHDIYELEKAYRHAKSARDVETWINNLRAFQHKFLIKESALAAIVYNECLSARGEKIQPFRSTTFERMFSGFFAFCTK